MVHHLDSSVDHIFIQLNVKAECKLVLPILYDISEGEKEICELFIFTFEFKFKFPYGTQTSHCTFSSTNKFPAAVWEYRINLATLACLEIMLPEIIKIQILVLVLSCGLVFYYWNFLRIYICCWIGVRYLFTSCPLIFHSGFPLM